MSRIAFHVSDIHTKYTFGERHWVSISPFAFTAHFPELRNAELLIGRDAVSRFADYDLVYSSACYSDEVVTADNVVVGGPAVKSGPLEYYFGKPLSSTLSPVWDPTDLAVISLGTGCYWAKCRYCFSKGHKMILRPDIPAILKQLQSFGERRVFLELEGPDIDTTCHILRSKGPSILNAYSRPEVLLESLHRVKKPLVDAIFSVGAEALDDATLRFLGRGHSVATYRAACELAMTRGVGITLLLMGPHPGDGDNNRLEGFLNWLDNLPSKYLKVRWTGPTVYPKRTSPSDIPFEDGFLRRVSAKDLQVFETSFERFVISNSTFHTDRINALWAALGQGHP